LHRWLPLVAAMFVLATRAAAASAAEDPRELEGRTRFAKGDYERALDIYARLSAESNDPVYLRNIGRCYQKMRQPEKAIDSFREYLRRAPRLKASERKEVDGFIHDMERLADEQRAKRATEPPPPVDLRPPAPPPAPAPVVASLTAQPAPAATEDRPLYTRWWLWTTAGAVAAGAVVAAVMLSGSRPAVGDCMGVSPCVQVRN
jgi:tetratricopeptide (TPR) repeat protein